MRVVRLPLFVGSIIVWAGVTFAVSRHDTTAVSVDPPHSKLVWSDEFNGPASSPPDSSKWTVLTGQGLWGNHELENYTSHSENVEQRGGNLVITARKEPSDGSGSETIHAGYTSGRVQTKGNFEQTYGRFEARM